MLELERKLSDLRLLVIKEFDEIQAVFESTSEKPLEISDAQIERIELGISRLVYVVRCHLLQSKNFLALCDKSTSQLRHRAEMLLEAAKAQEVKE